MRTKLTSGFLENIAPTELDQYVFDTQVPGLFVRVTPAGLKLFSVQARFHGQKRRVTIGRFPETSLSDARTEARNMIVAIKAGVDPKVEKAARKAAQEAGAVTVASFSARWLHEHVRLKLKPRTADDYVRLINGKIKPALGHLLVGKVTKEHVAAFHASMAKTPRRANYAAAVFRSLMTYAEDLGLRPPMSNPCRRLKLYREGKRERFLSESEIARAAEAIATAEREGKIGIYGAAGLRLALLTGARSGEICAARWEHVDWQRKLIRLPDSKTNDQRSIYLSDAALEVLRTLPRTSDYVIAGGKTGQPYASLSGTWILVRRYASLEDVRLHDLRHSFASLAAARGVSLPMIGKLLGHKTPLTTARYAHLARDVVAAVNDDIGAAMQAAIERGQPESADVVKLRRRRPRA